MAENLSWNQERLAIQATSFADSPSQAARAFYQRGRQELEAGNPASAARFFEAALKEDPRYVGAWHDLGIAQCRLAQWEAALAAFEQALERAPGDAEILFKKGLCQVHAGLLREAMETLAAAVESGNHLEARFQLGLLFTRESQRRQAFRQQAIEQFEAILQAVDAGQECRNLERVCFALGNLYDDEAQTRVQAIAAYRRGLAVNSLSAVGHNSLGLSLLRSGQVLGALGEFKVAIQLDPAFRSPYSNLANLLYHYVKPGDLAQEYEHLLEEFEEGAHQVLSRLSLELVELARTQAYEGLYTKGHQLKNLLGIVGSRLRGLVRREREAGSPWEGELATLTAEHERLYEEWVGFLGVMKPEPVHPLSVEPARLVRRVVELVKSQSWKSELRVRVQEGVPRFEADERMLREAITNLLLNALEACEVSVGGEVILGVGYDPERSGVFIEIEDNGPGIAAEHLDHIFTPGFTSKEQGNGYGLSIARRIAHAHHGELRVKSRLGMGTVFRLDLPLDFEGGDSLAELSLG